MRIKHSVGAGLLALSVALMSACAGSGSAAPKAAGDAAAELVKAGVPADIADQLDALYQEALKGDTTINFYGTSALPLEATFVEFEKTFPGLDVVGTQLNSPDTITRVNAEGSSGNVSYSLVSGTAEVMAAIGSKQYVQSETPIDAANLADVAKDPGGYYGYAMAPWGYVYPADADPASLPKTWKDLVGGKYSGSVAAVDPKTPGLTQGQLVYLLEAGIITEDDVKALAKSDLTPYADSGAMTTAVGTGEKSLSLVNSYAVFAAQMKAGGYDLKFGFPLEDANIVTPALVSVAPKAPNQAAAELLFNYLFTAPAQNSAATNGFIPVLQGIDGPPEFPSLADIPNPVIGVTTQNSSAVYEKWQPVIDGAFGS